jgi:hypothetical protein
LLRQAAGVAGWAKRTLTEYSLITGCSFPPCRSAGRFRMQ